MEKLSSWCAICEDAEGPRKGSSKSLTQVATTMSLEGVELVLREKCKAQREKMLRVGDV